MSSATSSALLTCAEALLAVKQQFAALPLPAVETVPLLEAQGRVLAAPLVADRDQPPFPRSTRDGFAVRAADLGSTQRRGQAAGNPTAASSDAPNAGGSAAFAAGQAGAALRVVGAIRAGEAWAGAALRAGEAIEIMTGAPVPAGADAILMVEHAVRDGDTLRVERLLRSGENIVPQGAEATAGQEVLPAGVRLGPAEIALAASVGAATLPVYARPVTAILSTGDELVDVRETPGPQQIRNSNAYALAALVRANGGEPRVLPVAADTREALEVAVAAAAGAAMLVLSGGVSAGKYDLVEPVLLSRGAEFLFTGVRMQPGKPAVFGRMKDGEAVQWIFGLPGNPVSTQVTAQLFAMPMLRALGGERDAAPVFADGVLTERVKVRPGLTRFLPARMVGGLDGVHVTPTGWQGSGDLASNARANCSLVVPDDVETLNAGAAVRVLLR